MTTLSFKIFEKFSESTLIHLDNVPNEKRLSYLAKKAAMDYCPEYFETLFVMTSNDDKIIYPLSTWV